MYGLWPQYRVNSTKGDLRERGGAAGRTDRRNGGSTTYEAFDKQTRVELYLGMCFSSAGVKEGGEVGIMAK